VRECMCEPVRCCCIKLRGRLRGCICVYRMVCMQKIGVRACMCVPVCRFYTIQCVCERENCVCVYECVWEGMCECGWVNFHPYARAQISKQVTT